LGNILSITMSFLAGTFSVSTPRLDSRGLYRVYIAAKTSSLPCRVAELQLFPKDFVGAHHDPHHPFYKFFGNCSRFPLYWHCQRLIQVLVELWKFQAFHKFNFVFHGVVVVDLGNIRAFMASPQFCS
jgi:hypothetical protein